MIYVLVLLIALVPTSFIVGRRSAVDNRTRALREHAKFLRRARWASLRRQDGLANIYVEAAERVLRTEGDAP